MFPFNSRVVVLALLFFTSSLAQALELAVVSPRGVAATVERWSAFGDYLSAQVGEKVSILPMTALEVRDAADKGEVDLVLTHSAHTVVIMEEFDGRVLATLDSGAGPRFGGVIIARKDSGIDKMEDLKGKRVVAMKFKQSAGAYIFQVYELHKAGIDPHKDFASFTEGKTQDELVMAVVNGEADAAFIRTDMLEKMAKEGVIKADAFTIVNARKENGFPYALSTELYAEWCLSVMPHVPEEVATAVSNAVLKLTPEHPAAAAAEIEGFVAPVSMENIKLAMKVLRISPYNK